MPKRKTKTKHLPPAKRRLNDNEILMYLHSSEDEEDDSDDDNLPPVVIDAVPVLDLPYLQEEEIISEYVSTYLPFRIPIARLKVFCPFLLTFTSGS